MNDERMTITAISAKAELANMLAHWLVKLLVQPIIIKKKTVESDGVNTVLEKYNFCCSLCHDNN